MSLKVGFKELRLELKFLNRELWILVSLYCVFKVQNIHVDPGYFPESLFIFVSFFPKLVIFSNMLGFGCILIQADLLYPLHFTIELSCT